MYVAVGKAGLKLSPAAADYLARAEKVELLFDPEPRAIAVRAAKITSPRAVAVKRDAGGGIVIACPAFIAMLDISGSRQGNQLRYTAVWDASEHALIATDVAFRTP